MIRPLDVFERALLISDRYSPFSPITVFQITPCLPPGVVGQALDLLQANHSLLCACIVVEAGRPCFRTMLQVKTDFQALLRRGETHWQAVVQQELVKRIDFQAGPLFSCVYLYSEAGNADLGEIILKFHHTIADASVIYHLTNELLELCARLQTGQPIEPAVEAPNPPVLESTFPARYKGQGRIWHSLVYAFAQIGDEIGYRWRTRGKRAPSVKGPSELHTLTLDVPEELTAALARRARKEGVTLPNLLNADLLLAANRQLYLGVRLPMRTFVFADLRPYTVPPTPPSRLGCVISMLRYTLDVNPGQSIWQHALRLQTQVIRSFRRGDKYIANLFSASLMTMFTKLKAIRMGSTGLSFTALPGTLAFSNGVEVRSIVGFASNIDLGPEITATVTSYAGHWWWGFTFFENDLSVSQAQTLVENIRNILESAL